MNKQNQARLALLFALAIFTTLGFVMVNSGNLRLYKPEEVNNRMVHLVQLDVRGDLINDHVVVQDTLSHYMAQALPATGNLSSNWEMNYCCDEPELYASNEDQARVFQWWGEFSFDNSVAQEAFLRQLLTSDQVNIDRYEYQDGILVGIASANLPVPGPAEGIVELQEIRFNLRTTAV